ncbi:hypothetical protein CRG98_026627 [Punica granatum]|uniref:Uncharacterized protein n=1 Tax=Punica granatum TaxID=22663 RepID=A0A2I0J9X3_PUNGR|nr:hypothetical protein CRG98_026627 [Punica granatum]
MAKPPRPSASPSHLLYLLSLLSLLIIHLSTTCVLADSHFEGFEADDEDEALDSADSLQFSNLRSPPVSQSESPPATTKLTPSEPDTATADPTQSGTPDHPPTSPDLSKPSSTGFDYWDEDEFEGLPFLEQHQQQPSEPSKAAEDAVGPQDPSPDPKSTPAASPAKRSYMVEIVCGSFLIMFAINYFTGKRENENIALAWAAKHDLISRIYNLIVPCKDEISFEVYMNDDAMDNVIFAVAKKKAAKGMQKELRDLQRFAGLLPPPGGRKWVAEELSVISESKEVAGDMITEAVLDQLCPKRAFVS